VHGLNLDVPETAKELIKSWENRDDEEKFVESNVDDQVSICHCLDGSRDSKIYS